MDLLEWGEKIKETSSLTRTLASRVLDRVREFKATFSSWPEPIREEIRRLRAQPIKKGKVPPHRHPSSMKASAKTGKPSKSKRTQPVKSKKDTRRRKK